MLLAGIGLYPEQHRLKMGKVSLPHSEYLSLIGGRE